MYLSRVSECIKEEERKKERCGYSYISTPSRANQKLLQRKVGYSNIILQYFRRES